MTCCSDPALIVIVVTLAVVAKVTFLEPGGGWKK